ncbi:MAG TPA: hypothetical protein VHY08_09225 [Bacillota bacterium]|nr:hypothetical protein [Bacillota bacterium]
MQTFTEKPKAPEQATSAQPVISSRTPLSQNYDVNSMLRLQRTVGNHAVARLLRAQAQELKNESPANALTRFARDFSRIPVHAGAQTAIQPSMQVDSSIQSERFSSAVFPTAMEDQGKSGSEAFEGEPVMMQPEGSGDTPPPLNEDGLIDGEWSSEIAVTAFMNQGRTGRAMVHWAGGGGARGGQPAGDINLTAPVIESSNPPAAGGTAEAWVRTGTGSATVTRSYTGVLSGANGPNYYITNSAMSRIDTHEEGHIASSRTHHNTHITPLETRVRQHTGQANALRQGATAAQAQTALETFLNWNVSITNFRTADITDNQPMGTWDRTEIASPDFYRNYGARTVGGTNYANYYDTPPGPGP